jgi:hypothetical protein
VIGTGMSGISGFVYLFLYALIRAQVYRITLAFLNEVYGEAAGSARLWATYFYVLKSSEEEFILLKKNQIFWRRIQSSEEEFNLLKKNQIFWRRIKSSEEELFFFRRIEILNF